MVKGSRLFRQPAKSGSVPANSARPTSSGHAPARFEIQTNSDATTVDRRRDEQRSSQRAVAEQRACALFPVFMITKDQGAIKIGHPSDGVYEYVLEGCFGSQATRRAICLAVALTGVKPT